MLGKREEAEWDRVRRAVPGEGFAGTRRGGGRERGIITVDRDRAWRGSPLDMGSGLDPYGIEEVVIEFEDGGEDVFRPKLRTDFASYELYQMAAYLESVGGSVRKGRKR